MILKSRYNLGDHVFVIRSKGSKTIADCPACLGTGRLHDAAGGRQLCYHREHYQFIGWDRDEQWGQRIAECGGSGKIEKWLRDSWQTESRIMTIGRIEMKVSGDAEVIGERDTRYMCIETGIGTGTQHLEDDLFLDTPGGRVEADSECARRNALREASAS